MIDVSKHIYFPFTVTELYFLFNFYCAVFKFRCNIPSTILLEHLLLYWIFIISLDTPSENVEWFTRGWWELYGGEGDLGGNEGCGEK